MLLIHRSGQVNEGFTKDVPPFLFTDVVFDLPEHLIELFEPLDQCGLKNERKAIGAQPAQQSRKNWGYAKLRLA